MALFPMTFPFYFDEAQAYSPFRILVDEGDRIFGTIPEDPRMFLDPSFAPRLPEIATKELTITALENEKENTFINNLPNWSQVENAIIMAFPKAEQQNVILKGFRVLYLLARNSIT